MQLRAKMHFFLFGLFISYCASFAMDPNCEEALFITELVTRPPATLDETLDINLKANYFFPRMDDGIICVGLSYAIAMDTSPDTLMRPISVATVDRFGNKMNDLHRAFNVPLRYGDPGVTQVELRRVAEATHLFPNRIYRIASTLSGKNIDDAQKLKTFQEQNSNLWSRLRKVAARVAFYTRSKEIRDLALEYRKTVTSPFKYGAAMMNSDGTHLSFALLINSAIRDQIISKTVDFLNEEFPSAEYPALSTENRQLIARAFVDDPAYREND